MSCQKEIAKKIIAGKGDYVLSLKENQLTLHEYAETYFKDALEHPQRYPEMTSYETVDKGHGRIEKRTYYLSLDLSGLENAADWSGLSGFGMVRSQVAVGEAMSSEISDRLVFSFTEDRELVFLANLIAQFSQYSVGSIYISEFVFTIKRNRAKDNVIMGCSM